MNTLRNTWVKVNLDNLENNIREIKKNIKEGTKIGAVLKANAYGHGVIEVAKVMIQENIDYLCVASLNEALEIRKVYKDFPILVMGYIDDENINIAIKNNITMTIFTKEQAINVSKISYELCKIGKIHIKFDTGFNRLGFKIEEGLIDTIKEIKNLKNIHLEGIFSHLALKDLESDYKQFHLFDKVIKQIEDEKINIPIKHICDSIGAVAYPDYHMDMVRIGASLYGYNSRKSSMNLKPVLTFKSKISFIKEIKNLPLTLDTFLRLKEKWKVSVQMIIRKCYDLHLISDDKYTYFQKRISYKGWRRNEPLDDILIIEQPRILRDATELLIDSNKITKQQMVDEMALSKDDIIDLCNLSSDFFADNLTRVIKIY